MSNSPVCSSHLPGKCRTLLKLAALMADLWLPQVLLSLWDFCHPAHWPIYGVLIVVCCAFEGLHIFIVSPTHLSSNCYVQVPTCYVMALHAETQPVGRLGLGKYLSAL